MAVRLDIRPIVPDSRALTYKNAFNNLDLTGRVTEVFVVDSYLLDFRLSARELAEATTALTNPTIEQAHVNQAWAPNRFHSAAEIGFLPGVTDNVGTTANEVVSDRLSRPFQPGEGIY